MQRDIPYAELDYPETICAVSCSPKHPVAAFASDREIYLWKIENQSAFPLEHHEDAPLVICYSQDGSYIAVSRGKRVKLWSIEYCTPLHSNKSEGEVENYTVRSLRGHSTTVRVLCFIAGETALCKNETGLTLISGSEDCEVFFWNPLNGNKLKRLRLPQCVALKTMSASFNNQFLAFNSEESVLIFHQADSQIYPFEGHAGEVLDVSYSPNDLKLASSAADNTVRLWDSGTGQALGVLIGHTDFVRTVRFSPCGQFVASGSLDMTVRVWKAKTLEQICTFKSHSSSVSCLSFSCDGKFIVSGGDDCKVQMHHVAQRLLLKNTIVAEFSPNSQFVAYAKKDGTVRVWRSLQTNRPVYELRGDSTVITAVSFSPDGQFLATVADDTILVWNNGYLYSTIPQSLKNSVVCFSHDSRLIAYLDESNTPTVWDINARQIASILHNLVSPRDEVKALHFSPNNALRVAANQRGGLRVWDSQETVVLFDKQYTAKSDFACFSPDATHFAIALNWFDTCSDRKPAFPKIILWDLAQKKEIWERNGIEKVEALFFSPDDRYLVSGHATKIALWDFRGKFLRAQIDCPETLQAICISPNRQLLSADFTNDTLTVHTSQLPAN